MFIAKFGFANIAEVWPNLQSFGQICRALANFAELWRVGSIFCGSGLVGSAIYGLG